jgi:GT2 family glycosyltransferase
MQQVLIIVLSHNKKDMVLECLESLERQEYGHCQIVVFDNGSSDGSPEAIKQRFPSIDLVSNGTNLGAIRGRNAAVEYAAHYSKFDYVLFLDDDAETGIESIKLLVEALKKDPEAGLACGKTYIRLDSNIIMSTGIRERLYLGLCYDRGAGEQDDGQFEEDGYVDACGAFAFMIRFDLFEELAGFDEIFSPYGWEDVDLCLRARDRGYRTLYVHDAVFAHKGTRMGRKPVPHYERNKAKGFLTLLSRHTTILERISAAFFVPLRGLLLLMRFAAQGNRRAITAQLKGIGDFFRARIKTSHKS